MNALTSRAGSRPVSASRARWGLAALAVLRAVAVEAAEPEPRPVLRPKAAIQRIRPVVARGAVRDVKRGAPPNNPAPARPRKAADADVSQPAVCRGLEPLLEGSRKSAFSTGEELAYELKVSGAYVGRFETKVGKPRVVDGRKVIPLFGRARTSSFVSTFKEFTGRYMAMVDPEALFPVGVRVEATYGGEERWERVTFAPSGRSVSASFFLEGAERERSYSADHALTDVLSLLYAARTIPLAEGLEACQEVFGARRLWRMDARVAGTAMVDTPAGAKDAFVVRTVFERKPHPSLSNDKRPRVEIDVFFSRDERQAPLAFDVRSPEFEARGDLVHWRIGG